MNIFLQLWRLIRDGDETPTLVNDRQVLAEAKERQEITRDLIQKHSAEPSGPLFKYIWGEGKRRD